MVSRFKSIKGFFPFLVLLALSLRVLTGAAEAQVNFTTIVVDEYIPLTKPINQHALLSGVEASDPADASSIPENLRTYSTYKKYLTPESSFLLPDMEVDAIPEKRVNPPSRLHIQIDPIQLLPNSHSPPAVMFTSEFTHMTKANHLAVWENKFEKFKDLYIGGFYRL